MASFLQSFFKPTMPDTPNPTLTPSSSSSKPLSQTSQLPSEAPQQQEDQQPSTSIFSLRSRKQATLFFAGASFVLLSSFITRRALRRRAFSARPALFQPSTQSSPAVNGPIEAIEALSLASINVASAALMLTGGVLWALDISTVEEMRVKIRGGLGVDGSGRSEKEAEEDFEEWLAGVLARKEKKERAADGGRAKDSRTEDGRAR